MAVERTLSIVKPDAVAKNVIGQIYSRFENLGLKVVAARMLQLSQKEAEGFYAVHRERPFFASLTAFMSSGPAIVLVLEAPDANPFLPRFYEERERYALPTQLFFLFQRFDQLRAMAQHDLFARVRVADFLLEKDPLFARLTLSGDELALYQKIFDALQQKA